MNGRWALFTGAALVVVALIIGGDQVPACLGPLGVTIAQCAHGLAARGEVWAPGPGPGSAVLIGMPLVVFVATLIPWRRVRWLGLLVSGAAGLVAGVIGALYYDMTRPTSITQTNEFSGVTHTAPLGANGDLRILTGLFAAAVIGTVVAWLVALFSDRKRHPAS